MNLARETEAKVGRIGAVSNPLIVNDQLSTVLRVSSLPAEKPTVEPPLIEISCSTVDALSLSKSPHQERKMDWNTHSCILGSRLGQTCDKDRGTHINDHQQPFRPPPWSTVNLSSST